jgi:hypothetical protein
MSVHYCGRPPSFVFARVSDRLLEVTQEYERATAEFQRLQKSYKSQRALEVELKRTIDIRDHAMEEYM